MRGFETEVKWSSQSKNFSNSIYHTLDKSKTYLTNHYLIYVSVSGPMNIITEYTSKWKLKVDEVSKKAEEAAGNVWQHRKRVFPYLSLVHILFFSKQESFYMHIYICVSSKYIYVFSLYGTFYCRVGSRTPDLQFVGLEPEPLCQAPCSKLGHNIP